MHRELKISSPEKENLERLIQLFLKMSLIGFDELEMSEREEAVKLFGEKVKCGIEEFNRRLIILEDKVQSLEQSIC